MGTTPVSNLRQAWPRPSRPRPIVIIGAGGIVNDAHLPAYRLAEFPVAGIFDLDRGRADALAAKWGLTVFSSLAEAAAVKDAVFDLATPPAAHVDVLRALPEGSAVLIQKPMGRDLDEATRILELARARNLTAAVNFQLRFAPMMLALSDALERGLLGRLIDVEIHLNILTPWHLFPFLKGLPRVEIAVHSIHYFDFIRSLLGNPTGVYARTMGHPSSDMAQTRTSAILDFGDNVRCTLSINHDHDFGRRFQDSTFRFEGDQGGAVVKMGILLNYPQGEPDELWIAQKGGDWAQVPLQGGWFPHAFVGVMSNLQRFAAGEDPKLITAVADAWHTMAVVEACFASSAAPATPVPSNPKV
ncbi:Gfo/Idh/MocA family protein [Dongia sedimenti]|uniref:Gfo/Idh/MocA family oxidoreductase n=1 Tax=Dongia sedimenti TaxID=3064282 RepID=A0ABU0YMI9_9PROT|nr:Gfo/Idh/MocA family oxidoreductase [Rhodospirillaceae bacterium R-7]